MTNREDLAAAFYKEFGIKPLNRLNYLEENAHLIKYDSVLWWMASVYLVCMVVIVILETQFLNITGNEAWYAWGLGLNAFVWIIKSEEYLRKRNLRKMLIGYQKDADLIEDQFMADIRQIKRDYK